MKLVNSEIKNRVVEAVAESCSGQKYYLTIDGSYVLIDDVPPEQTSKNFDTIKDYLPLESYDRLDGEDYYKSSISFAEVVEELIIMYNLPADKIQL